MTIELNFIVAISNESGIGINGQLPWNIKADMQYFQQVTTYFGRSTVFPATKSDSNEPLNIVIMGRKTYTSIPVKFRPLKNRINIVLSRNEEIRKQLSEESVSAFSSLQEALEWINGIKYTSIFIIGGSGLFAEAMPMTSRIFLTRVNTSVKCDVFLPPLNEFAQISEHDMVLLLGKI